MIKNSSQASATSKAPEAKPNNQKQAKDKKGKTWSLFKRSDRSVLEDDIPITTTGTDPLLIPTPDKRDDSLLPIPTLSTPAPTMVQTPPPVPAIAYTDLTLGKLLGKGAYGAVYEGTYQFSKVAIKKLAGFVGDEEISKFTQEATLMATLRHPHVVTFYGACLQAPDYAVVMEYLPQGSLANVLSSPAPLAWNIRYQIGLDVGSGMVYLHSRGIIHADLKSANVLLDNHYRAKVSDFGISKVKPQSFAPTEAGTSYGGTLPWMAPELFEADAKTSKASDSYSYGMVLWELGARQVPFIRRYPNIWAIPEALRRGEQETITPDTPPAMAQVITRCWNKLPTARPILEDAVKEMLEEQKSVPALRL